jgi:hypothetical protein
MYRQHKRIITQHTQNTQTADKHVTHKHSAVLKNSNLTLQL